MKACNVPFSSQASDSFGLTRSASSYRSSRDVEALQQVGVDEAVDRERQRAVRVGIERAAGAIERVQRFLSRVGRPSLLDAQDVPLGEPGVRDRVPRHPVGQRLQQLPRPVEPVQRKAMHQRDRAHQERVGLERRERLRFRALELARHHCGAHLVHDGADELVLAPDERAYFGLDAGAPENAPRSRFRQLGDEDELAARDAVGTRKDVARVQMRAQLAHRRLASAERRRREPRDDVEIGGARERRDDLVRDHFAEHLVLGLDAARGERDHGDGRPQFGHASVLVGSITGKAPGGRPGSAHRLLDVLEVALAQVFHLGVDRGDELIAHLGRDHDLTGPGELRPAALRG